MIKKQQNTLKIALQHNLKYIKIKNNSSRQILIKNYALYVHKNKIALNSSFIKKLLNV